MRILFFSNEFPSPHDPLKAVFNLRMCESLGRRHEVSVAVPIAWTARGVGSDVAPRFSAALRVAYAPYYFAPRVLRSSLGLFMWWSLRSTLRQMVAERRPDVILSYWTHPDGEVALRLARECALPFVQIVGGSDVLLGTSHPARWKRIVSVLRCADEVVAVGPQLATRVAALGVDASRLTVMYRPVDTARFSPGSQADARRRLDLAAAKPLILWVGRLVPVKAVDTLLKAVAQVRTRWPDAMLYLIGDGPEQSNLEELARALGMADAVHFAGPVPHDALPDWFRAADVSALPSLSEGLPNVLLESLACGTPFVASEVGSIPNIADPVWDRVVPPRDDVAFGRALIEILERRTHAPRTSRLPAAARDASAPLEAVLSRAARSHEHRMAAAS